jgi:hypothetical protein
MATTKGLVQRILHQPLATAYFVYIGPSPTNVTLFWMHTTDAATGNIPPAAKRITMSQVLTGALFARREVEVYDDTVTSRIDGVNVLTGSP